MVVHEALRTGVHSLDPTSRIVRARRRRIRLRQSACEENPRDNGLQPIKRLQPQSRCAQRRSRRRPDGRGRLRAGVLSDEMDVRARRRSRRRARRRQSSLRRVGALRSRASLTRRCCSRTSRWRRPSTSAATTSTPCSAWTSRCQSGRTLERRTRAFSRLSSSAPADSTKPIGEPPTRAQPALARKKPSPSTEQSPRRAVAPRACLTWC